MRTSPKKLTFWILVLGLCIGAIVLVPFFRANKASKLTNQLSEAEETQKAPTENLSKLGDAVIKPFIATSKNGVQASQERTAKTSSEFEDNASIQPIAIKDKRVRQREIEALEKTGDSQSIVLLISAVKMVTEGGHSTAEVARGLGIHPNQLYNWKKKYSTSGEKAFIGKGHLTEISLLRKQLREVQLERDILKKAVGIFSKTTENDTNL